MTWVERNIVHAKTTLRKNKYKYIIFARRSDESILSQWTASKTIERAREHLEKINSLEYVGVIYDIDSMQEVCAEDYGQNSVFENVPERVALCKKEEQDATRYAR